MTGHALNEARHRPEHCAECHDTGKVIFECTGDRTCGRPYVHLAHTYTTALGCPCVATNPVFQARRSPSGWMAA